MTATLGEDEFVKKQIKKSLEELRGAVTAYVPTKEERALGKLYRRAAHAPEIAHHNNLRKALDELNETLVPLGEPAIEVEAVDLVELDARTLRARISQLEGLVRKRQAKLDELHEAAAAAELQRFLAAESPHDRMTRERIERLEADNDQLKAELRALQPSRHVSPKRPPLPIMPYLSPGITQPDVPPIPQSTRGAARGIGHGAPRAPLPPMGGMGTGRRGQGEGDTSPDEFRRACGGE